MQTAAMTKKLIVGNLPDSAHTSTVQDLFNGVGRVLSVALVRDGFAFVVMMAADADKARRQLNGHRLEGKTMMVDEAHPKGPARY